MAKEIFFSYAHEDEELREELEKQLSLLKWEHSITTWDDRKVGAGQEWADEIDMHLNKADMILLLVSPDFMASDNCNSQVARAMKRHQRGEARVIPIILRPVDWRSAPFRNLQALPNGARPVTKWQNQDEALSNVAKGIRNIVEKGNITSLRTLDTSLKQRGIIGLLPPTERKTISQRESEVRAVYEQLIQPGVSTLVLTGLDGVGKSTLAALVYNYAREQQLAGRGPFTTDPFWIKIDPTVTMIELAAALFKALGQPLPDISNFSLENQALTLFQALNKASKPFLIVLDQFDHLLDAQTGYVFTDRPGLGEWLKALNSRQCRCRILITSRHFPSDFNYKSVQKYSYEGLDIADGIELLRKQGVEASESDLRAAVLNCGGIALALQLLVSDLSNRKLSLRAFLKDPRNIQFWKGNVARNLVDSIYTHHLNDLQRKLLAAFSVYREAVTLEAVEAILDEVSRFSNSQILSALNVLLAQNLLQASGDGLYHVQMLIDNFIEERLVQSGEQINLQTAHYHAAKYYLQQAGIDEQLEEKRENINDMHHLIEAVWHLCRAERWSEAYTLLYQKKLYTYLKLWGENRILLDLIKPFEPTDKWHANNSQEANIYNSLGMTYNLLGQKKEALNYYQRALSIVEGRDRQEEGKTLRHIGRVYNALGKKKEALRYFEQALNILQDGKEPVEVGITYERLGRVYNVLGQKEKAVAAYQQALKIYEEVRYASGKGTTLSYLGRVYGTLGQGEQGLKLSKQGLGILRGIGDRRGKAVHSITWGVFIMY